MLSRRLTNLAHRLRNLPPWWIGCLLAVAFLCVAIGFAERSASLEARIAEWEYVTPDSERIALCGERQSDGRPKPVDRRTFDGRSGGYNAEEAICWLTAIGPEGRSLYAWTQATLDVVFPFAYGLLFAILVARGLPRKDDESGDFCCVWLLFVPVATVGFDLVEGLLTILMATAGPDGVDSLPVGFASLVTMAKSALFLASVAVIAFLGRRFLGHMSAHLVLARVPALGLAVVCLLPMQAIARQATVVSVFNLETGLQLGLTSLMAVFAIVLLGHAFVIAWRLGSKRTGMQPLDLPLFAGEMTMRPLVMTSALATVLVLPFLWVLGTRAEPDVPRLALAIGALTAGAALAACLWIVQRLSERMKGKLLDLVLMRLGPGYWEDGKALPGHKLAAGFAVLLGIVYVAFYVPYSPAKTALPPAALPFVLLFITLVCQLLAGLAFFFDRWRVPVLLVLLAAALVVNSIFPKSHDFESRYLGAGDEAQAPATPNLGTGRTLTVIAADGGGIQAAAWSTQVLTSLQTELGDEFSDSVRLISSVSGGSVGAYFYLAGAAYDRANGPKPGSRDCVRRAASASSLSATAWGLVGPDFQRLLLPFAVAPTNDRGWALEHAWMNTAERMRRAIDSTKTKTGRPPTDCEPPFEDHRAQLASAEDALRLSTLRRLADDGTLPYLVFNSTFVETGGQAFFTTTDSTMLGCRVGEACWDSRNLDPRAATAARMSATFPYVTPIARPSLKDFGPGDPVIPQWSVADGGYFDNFGSFAAIRWLRHLRSELGRFDRVVLVQILTFPETHPSPPDGSEGLLHSTAGPLTTLLAVRTSSQLERTRVELEFLKESLTAPPEFDFVVLRPPYRPNQNAPLSWHLSRENIQVIRDQWREMCEADSGLDRLRAIFGASRSCGTPG